MAYYVVQDNVSEGSAAYKVVDDSTSPDSVVAICDSSVVAIASAMNGA